MESNFYRQSGGPSEGLVAAAGGGARLVLSRTVAERGTQSSHRDFRISVRDLHSPIQYLADTLAIVVLSIFTGTAFHLVFRGVYGPVLDFAGTGLVTALLFAVIDRSIERNDALRTKSFDRIRYAAQSWTLALGGLVFVFFAFRASLILSRGAVLSFYLVGLPLMALWRVFTPVFLAPLVHRAGSGTRECIVIGDAADPLLERFVEELQTAGHPAPSILKFRAACLPVAWPQELKGLVERVMDVAHESGPGEIYLCAGSIPTERLASISRALSILPRAIFVVPDAQTASLMRCKPASVGNKIALEIRHEPLGRAQRAIKRLIDVCVAGASLVLFSPLLAAVALLIKLDSPGPVFFRQTRNGYRGKPFRIWKFRSMHVQEDGPVIQQARANDARVTRVGRFLRKSSIDELPQLINVLSGEMSLVGPRPHAQAHDELYAKSIENYEVRQHVKPGLTGWAQANGLRGETATLDAMYRRIECDLWYAVNASVLLDIEILVRTAIEVCRQRNAY